MKRASGYTLIEILVVLVIISIVSSMALLTIGRSKYREVKNLTNDLVQVISLAQERAMLQPATLALSVRDSQIVVLTYQPASSEQAASWKQPDGSQGLSAVSIPDDLYVTLDVANKEQNRIIVSSNGELTPFTLYLGEHNQKPSFRIDGRADGGVTYEEL